MNYQIALPVVFGAIYSPFCDILRGLYRVELIRTSLDVSADSTTATDAKSKLGSATQLRSSDELVQDPHEAHLDNDLTEASPSPQTESTRWGSLGKKLALARNSPGLSRSTGTVDLSIGLLCFVAVHWVHIGNLEFSAHRLVILVASLVIIGSSLSFAGMYDIHTPRPIHTEIQRLAVSWLAALTLIGLFAYLSKTAYEVSRLWFSGSMILTFVLLTLVRLARALVMSANSTVRPDQIAIVGNHPMMGRTIEHVYNNAWCNKSVVAKFVVNNENHDRHSIEPMNGSFSRAANALYNFVESRRRSGTPVDEVWIALPTSSVSQINQLNTLLNDSSVDVCIVPDTYGQLLISGKVTQISGTSVVNISDVSLSAGAARLKRAFDTFVALTCLVLLAIPMILISIAVKLESKGPVLFKQRRYGVDGSEIEVWKFRSMFVHTDEQISQARRHDQRVTRVGRFIRNYSLDELPQLFNVLTGHMSMVGPRPHAVVHNETWRTQIDGYMLRHKVRPGITGLAQINGWRGETDTFEKMERRVHFDLEYIRNWSLMLDLKILMLTTFRGLSGDNVY